MMQTKTHLSRALSQAREQTDSLFALVRPDAFYERPIPERHRIIFYLGHIDAFDWNLIARYALDKRPFHPGFDRLFAFGIDPPPGQLPNDRPADWPSLAEVQRYNQRVRDELDELLEEVPEQLLHVALEHRLMHAETLAYILHQLEYDCKNGPALAPRGSAAEVRASLLPVPAGTARLGLTRGKGFGWDNEFQAHDLEVPDFAIGKYKVTNGEYLDFVGEGAAPPFFWADRGGRWMYRGMFAEFPLPLDAPVYVTWEEASAYARWRGRSLPSEAQYHRAAEGARPVNADFQAWDPVAVTDGEVEAGPCQMVGNGWEWTSTVFAPFQGFEPFPFYANYSAPFFDGRHYVLKGGSPRTAACFLRPSFRNWFRPAYPYIYATFRMVEA
jgi:iron(II)-dependent oxidoreductase